MFSKGKFMTRRNIYPLRENIVLSTKCSSVVILPERGWLVHPGVVPQLVVSAGGRSVIHQQVWPGETWWMEVMLLNPYITSVSITMTILFMCSSCSDRHGWGKKLTIHRMRHPFYMVIELLRCYTLMSIYTWYKYLCNLCPFGEIFPHSSSPDVFLTIFPFMVFPMIIQSVHWLQPMNQWTVTHITISPYKQNAWPCIPHNDLGKNWRKEIYQDPSSGEPGHSFIQGVFGSAN